jgi:hypothetical protein
MIARACAAVLLASCGGAGSPSAVDAGSADAAVVALADFPSRLVVAECTAAFACCTPAEAAQRFSYLSPPPMTEAECESRLSAFVASIPGLTADEQAIADGRLSYDGECAARVVSQLATVACSQFVPTDGYAPVCFPFTGHVANGSPCTLEEECASRYCEGNDPNGAGHLTGACKDMPGAGAPCPDSMCGPGLYCDVSCKPLEENGASCTFESDCQSGYCDVTCMDSPICNGL